MVCAGVLRGLILFFLFSSGVWGVGEGKTLDQNTLAPAIKFLRDNYQPGQNQYAIAFNAPADKCADYLDDNFLKTHPGHTVRDEINGDKRLYKGQKLIAAKPKRILGTDNNQHSEYLLLRLPGENTPPPMKELLDKDKKGCVVFYTYNSPCTKTCTNRKSPHHIIDALKMFESHEGPKAFVFTKVWENDVGKDISTDLKKVQDVIPLFRCKDDNSECVACTFNSMHKTDCVNKY